MFETFLANLGEIHAKVADDPSMLLDEQRGMLTERAKTAKCPMGKT
jgi:hypothetical protein